MREGEKEWRGVEKKSEGGLRRKVRWVNKNENGKSGGRSKKCRIWLICENRDDEKKEVGKDLYRDVIKMK